MSSTDHTRNSLRGLYVHIGTACLAANTQESDFFGGWGLFFCVCLVFFLVIVPSEIVARGPEAKRAYLNAIRSGETVKVYRGRIMLIGQDRAGKTSLKKNLLGLSFDPQEPSTNGIEVDPSKFEYDVDHVKNWKRTDEKVGVSNLASDLARIVAGKLRQKETNTAQTTKDDPDQVSKPLKRYLGS